MTDETTDPFEVPNKRPAYSWRGATKGTTMDGRVLELPREVQQRDFDTGEPDFWDGERTQPKMAVVVPVLVDGDEVSLWCPKPSAIFRAVVDAKEEAGEPITPGGRLRVRKVGEKPDPKGKKNPQNLFKAKYDPPEKDAFAEPPEKSNEPAAEDVEKFDDDEPPF